MQGPRHLRPLLAAGVAALALLAPTAAAGADFGERTLELGARGKDVRTLQRVLTKLGFPTDVDGHFDRRTERSVNRYERSREMNANGVVTQSQARRMKRQASRRDEPDPRDRPPRFGERTLKLGVRGRDVQKLQRILTRMAIPTHVDGHFGTGTERSVKAYERWRKMRPNGVVTKLEARAMERLADRGVRRPKPTGSRHVFPVRGRHSFGGPGSRFGAPRSGHRHLGQDIAAAAGTTIVSVHKGRVHFRGYQAGGAGNYVVIHGRDRSDSVYMHLRGPASVRQGERVRAGERLGAVGCTGACSGPHLHFELWTRHWFDGGHAYDPLPKLRRWDR